MRRYAGSVRRVAKIWLFASALVLATLALGYDSRPAGAENTDIFFTRSTSSPSPETSIYMFVSDPNPLTLHVWARKVPSTYPRLGAFEVDIQYVSWLLSVNSITEDSVWLGSTGRTVGCNDPILEPNLDTGSGHANVSCYTIGAPPPHGPYGDGRLATLTVKAGAVPAVTTLTFSEGTFLVDTGQVVGGQVTNPAVIPATTRSVQIVIARCADFDGDGRVSLAGDILAVILRYQMTSQDPNWDPIYDLNDDGTIDLPNDILGTIVQYQMECTQPA